ncbi:hypothetical protein, partial [Campylobacter coli]|uniref:hypothetical protein n=1 Tax=Campylobacter coli TaxID=195 RepID=UPI0037F40C73
VVIFSIVREMTVCVRHGVATCFFFLNIRSQTCFLPVSWARKFGRDTTLKIMLIFTSVNLKKQLVFMG